MSEEREPKNLPLPWCRLYAQEFLVDEKFRRIAIETGEHILLIRGLYIMLMCMAAKTRARDGKITISEGQPMSPAEILYYLDLPAERAEPVLKAMEDLKMISRPDGEPWEVINFADRNPPSDATGAWRQKKWRKRQKDEGAESPTPSPPADLAKDKQRKGSKGPGLSAYSTPVDRLVQIFVNETGFWPPADPAQSKNGWEEPIKDWLMLAADDEEMVEDWIRRAIKRQRDRHHAYTKPAYIDGAVRMIAGQVELKKLWRQANALAKEHGAIDPPDLDEPLAKIIDAAGGWVAWCKLTEKVAKEKFTEAYIKVSHERSDKTTDKP